MHRAPCAVVGGGFVARTLALLVWAITLATAIWVQRTGPHIPAPISDAARAVDRQFSVTLVCTGIAFVLAQGLLGWCAWRYRAAGGRKARYTEGHRGLEAGAAVLIGAVFLGLAVAGQRVWAQLHLAGGPADALVVEVTGEQFAWNVRYAGADGRFGRTDPRLYDAATNPVGIVADDADGADDVVALNTMAVPVGRAVEVRLGSKDVLHSFFVPALRIKQDTVPGMRIPLRFVATQAGTYEVPCAELCGLGHYRMKGTLRVLAPAEFDAWLTEQKAE
jgi:cytochrome c oxidase subunit 2